MIIDFITFQISSDIFGGYQYKIPKMNIKMMTNDEIIAEVKISMRNFFESHNLLQLKDRIDKLQLHIHSDNSEENIVYICNHDHIGL